MRNGIGGPAWLSLFLVARSWRVCLTLLLLQVDLRLDAAVAAHRFTVATFNVENYTDVLTDGRPAKSETSRSEVRESIRALKPDVLGLQEIGGTNTLLELRSALKADGFEYPYWEHVTGWDSNICVAVLSRFPIVARRPHTQEGFLLNGRRFRMTRGIAEVDIQVAPGYLFTLMVAHLKSKRPSAAADEADLREQEALILREKIDLRFRANPHVNLAVVGDLNDVKDALSTRAVLGKGRFGLVDTRPAERNGDSNPRAPGRSPNRSITWTHFFSKEDTYSRLDYILVSPGMAKEWDPGGTYVLALPNWGLASDHRPIVASFVTQDK